MRGFSDLCVPMGGRGGGTEAFPDPPGYDGKSLADLSKAANDGQVSHHKDYCN